MGTNSADFASFGIGKERPLEIWGRKAEQTGDSLRRLGLIFRLCEKIRCNFDLEELEFRQGERERGMLLELDVTKGTGCPRMF